MEKAEDIPIAPTSYSTSGLKMATVIRIKRRRDENPMEALLISRKRSRNQDFNETNNDGELSELTSIVKFAGTVNSKFEEEEINYDLIGLTSLPKYRRLFDCSSNYNQLDETGKYGGLRSQLSKELGVSQHVKDAIRKEKLEREYKQHQVHQSDILQQSRQHRRQSTNANRYKIITSHRAINLADLDSSETLNQLESDVKPTQPHQNNGAGDRLCSGNSDPENNGHTHRISEKTGHNCNSDVNSCERQSGVSTLSNSAVSAFKYSVPFNREGDVGQQNTDSLMDPGTAASESEASNRQTDSTFCLIDVEQEENLPQNSVHSVPSSSSEITCNSVPMIIEKVQHGGGNRGEEEYVYDLYYTNSHDFDFRFLENMLTVEALQQEQELVNNDEHEYEEVYDDDDDSNDENNWRNDYPDEDPRFFENDDADIYYRDDMHEFDAEEVQEGDLANWMLSRCNIEDGHDLSSDEEEHAYGSELPRGRGRSYDSYYRCARQETEECNNTIEDEEKQDAND